MSKADKQAVYEFLNAIPRGKVVTYGTIARYLGNVHLARAIGTILHQNPDGDRYPCYKVVNRAGRLSPHYAFGGLAAQRERLRREGISVADDRVDLSIYEWKP